MTEQELIFEGRASGIDFWDIYDWTWGEINDYIAVQNEKERRKNQTQSMIAFCHANLLMKMLNGTNEKIYLMNEFPFWTQDEINEATVERLRQSLMAKTKATTEA